MTTASITDAHLERALEAHLHPVHGSAFWLERQAELGFDLRHELHSLEDLPRLGRFPKHELVRRPLQDFVPRSIWAERTELVMAESGGTSGRPTRVVFTADEFERAFGRPFTVVSDALDFPRHTGWLFIGPSGPHVIAQSARLLARLHGALEPFSVDLDPRWARAQQPDSLGARLYLEHVVDQALDILARESVGVLFVTPPLALALAVAMNDAQRAAIGGLHLGGMALCHKDLTAIREAFPTAVVLPGYGNSLFGLMMPAREPRAVQDLEYFPLPGRLVVDVVSDVDGEPDLTSRVAPGERGRVVLSRLDESFLLPNLVERDEAELVLADLAALDLGLARHGLRDPRPVSTIQMTTGLY